MITLLLPHTAPPQHREELRRLGEERECFIAEHREKMRARAEQQGVELEDDE